ncbi:MAG: hypothetical protein JKY56_00105 [Kofleriaceae bacterium]|nr:hypothetical protein [Kofleriaceae bacterium]
MILSIRTLATSAFLLSACASTAQLPNSPDASSTSERDSGPDADSIVLGDFVDDYGIRYQITSSEWGQLPGTIFHISKWDSEEMYLIAQNDSANPGDGGLWTRIDWVLLPDMPDYPWAYCLTAYDARSAEAAEATQANRDQPRSGCNGFPFSRMKRLSSP